MASSTASSAMDIFTHPLALSPSGDQYLCCSLHKVENPKELALQLKEDGTIAMVDAARIVSPLQLVCAANQACHRQHPTWDTVFQAAGSAHLGHVLRDYAFLGEEDSSAAPVASAHVVLFLVGSSKDDFVKQLERYKMTESTMAMEAYFKEQQCNSAEQFRIWYKLTKEDIETSSLEQAILTRIATKLYV